MSQINAITLSPTTNFEIVKALIAYSNITNQFTYLLNVLSEFTKQ